MKKTYIKKIMITIFTILGGVLFALTLFYTMYQFDNKYTHSGPRPQKGQLQINQQRLNQSPIIPLVDDWAFYPHQLLSPEELSLGIGERSYTYIGENNNFLSKDTSPFGASTYQILLVNSGAPQTLILELPEVFSAYRLYLNGELVLSQGTLSPEGYSPKIQNRILGFTLTDKADIVLQVENHLTYNSGLYYPPLLGTPEAITQMIAFKESLYTSLCLLSLFFGLLFILGWYASPVYKKGYFNLFGLLCISFGVSISYPIFLKFGMSTYAFLYAIEDFSSALVLLSILLIFSKLARVGQTKLYRFFILPLTLTFCVLSLIFPLFIIPYYPGFISFYREFTNIHAVLLGAYLIYASVIAIKTVTRKKSLLLFANVTFLVGFLLNLIYSNRFEPIYGLWIREYLGLIFILIFGILMIFENRRLIEENQRLTTNLEFEVDKRTHQLNQMLKDRKQLLSNVAHDLKAPLTAIQQYLENIELQKEHLDPELMEYIDIIKRKSSQAQNRIGSLNQFSKKDESAAPKINLCINDLLKEFYQIHLPDLNAQGIYFHLNVPFKKSEIIINKEQLFYALENLLYNAVSHTSMEGTISLNLAFKNQTAIISLSDNGSGINPKDLPFIFDRFFTTQQEGQGLGLSIVKSIVTENNGRISADSNGNAGATFRISFPIYLKPIP